MKTKIMSLVLALILSVPFCMTSCDNQDLPAETVQETEAVSETERPEAKPVQFTLCDVSGKPGETVEIQVCVSGSVTFNSVALHEMSYDDEVLTFKGFSDTEAFEDQYCALPAVTDEDKKILMFAMKEVSSIEENVCKILFEINPDAKSGKTEVDMTSLVKLSSEIVESGVYAATITVAE